MSIEKMGDEFMRKYGSKPVKRKHKKRISSSNQGWTDEPVRHSMASYGIKSGRKTRDYTPKQTFNSAPYIKAGIGFGVAGLSATARFLAKKKADADRKRAEENAKQKFKEDVFYDGKITPAKKPLEENIPFVKNLKDAERKQQFKEAQLHAMQQREDQYARVLEARRNKAPQETKEQIEKDYASV